MDVFVGVEEVAATLGIKPSTVKKYYGMIEKNGYRFKRTNQGNLSFGHHDIEMFRRIIQIKNEPGVSVEKAVERVVSSITAITVYREPEETENTAPMIDMTVMIEQMKKMDETIIRLEKKIVSLEEEQKTSRLLIESKNNEQKEDWKIAMDTTNQMIKEILQEIAAAREKKGFWSRLFKKS